MDDAASAASPQDSPPASPSTDTADEPATPEEHPDEGEGQTGLLPKSFFMGKDKKPGDKCEVEVTHVYDDQIEVKYLDAQDKNEPGESAAQTGGGAVAPPAGMMGME